VILMDMDGGALGGKPDRLSGPVERLAQERTVLTAHPGKGSAIAAEPVPGTNAHRCLQWPHQCGAQDACAGLGVLNSVFTDTCERIHDLGMYKTIVMTPGRPSSCHHPRHPACTPRSRSWITTSAHNRP
jgi:hypothetical protein